jgi:hypothetical protein
MSELDKGKRNISYSTLLRQKDPQKMEVIEGLIRAFEKKIRIPTDQPLTNESIMMAANKVANNLRREIDKGATDEELERLTEDFLYEAVSVRQEIQKEHIDTKSLIQIIREGKRE